MLVLSQSDVQTVLAGFTTDDLLTMAQRSLTCQEPAELQHSSEPARLVKQCSNYTALFMPGWLPTSQDSASDSHEEGLMGIKVVSVPTGKAQVRSMGPAEPSGLPATTLLFDPQTGAVNAMINSGVLTAMRNAAGSLLASKLLLPRLTPVSDTHGTGSKSILLFGAGLQIRTHIPAFVQAYPSIQNICVVNRSIDHGQGNVRQVLEVFKAVEEFTKARGSHLDTGLLALNDTASVKEKVQRADIIVTATSSQEPLFESEDVQDGTLIILIGSYKPTMHEIGPDLLFRSKVPGLKAGTLETPGSTVTSIESTFSAQVLVDTREGVLTEAGEIINALNLQKASSSLATSALDLIEVRELCNGKRTSSFAASNIAGVRIYKSVGVAAQDIAIAEEVVRRAGQMGVGQDVDF